MSEETGYRRSLGLTEVLSIVISRIIGSGIFRTPGPMMIAVGSVGLFYGAWVLGGIITLLSAFLYAELVTMMPAAGGPYVFLRAAYPPVWAFLRGWAMFFVSETAAIVAVALVFAEYTGALTRSVTGAPLPAGAELFLALAIIWLHTAVNLFGVGFSGLLQDIFSAAKVLALIAVALASFSSEGSFSHLTDRLWTDKGGWGAVIAVFAALRYGFFAYSGWEGATYVAEEVKEPQRNLPISLFAGIGGVMVLYLAVNTAYLYQLSVDEILAAGKGIAGAAMQKAMETTGVVLISLAVMMSTFGNVATQVLVKARTWHAMARDGLFFRRLSTLHPVHRTPNAALIAQGLWATVLLGAASLASSAYETVIDFFSFTSAVFNISVLLAVPILRKKQPERERPYRAWGYPVTLVVVVALYTVFAGVTLYDAFLPSMAGVALTLTGLIYYRLCVKPAR